MIGKAQKKHIGSLQLKKYRKLRNEFIVEGNKSINDFIKNDFIPKTIYTTTPSVFDKSLPVLSIENNDLKSISFFKNPKDSLAIFQIKNEQKIDENKQILILDNIQDPGNLGTIIRTADWFGVQNIICSTDTVDCYNPKVVQASMGSLAKINIIYTDIVHFIEYYPYNIFGTFLQGDSIFELKFPKKMALIIGNEGNGIRKEVEKKIKNKITIPKHKNTSAESLNAAIATGIILSQMKKS